MIVGNKVKEKIGMTPEGVVLTISDFDVLPQYQGTLVKSLNRLVAKGTLKRLSKGKYYKPRQTIFGTLKLTAEEIIKDFIEKNGKLIGYITGNSAFASLGLTTQITSSLMIGTNIYRRPLERSGYNISFLLQRNSITEENIPLLRILDAIRLIKDIPATNPDAVIERLGYLIKELDKNKRSELLALAENYTPYVRALLGAIMELNNLSTGNLMYTLNGTTSYKIPVTETALPNKQNWNIL